MEDLTFDMKLSKLMVCIQVASWDTTVHASIDSLMIQDHYNTGNYNTGNIINYYYIYL